MTAWVRKATAARLKLVTKPDDSSGRDPLDERFDEVLPTGLRALSDVHWTPAAVAQLGARWLEEHRARWVLDIGSGVGKFCTLASLGTSLSCVGLEQRTCLVDAARAAAQRLGANRCQFYVGGLELLPAFKADALYFYNPFAENNAPELIGIDQTVELSPRRFVAEVLGVEEHLRRAPLGQLVLTFHGYGGRIPASYQQVRAQPVGNDFLRLFQKTERVEVPGEWLGEGVPP